MFRGFQLNDFSIAPSKRRERRTAVESWFGTELLESRRLLSTVTWTGAANDGGQWTNAGNWTGGTGVPQPGDSAVIPAGASTITIASGPQSVQSLTSASPLDLTGGSSLQVGSGGAQLSANFTLDGGTLQNSTLAFSGGAELVPTLNGGNVLDGVTLKGNLDLSQFAGATVNIENGLTMDGSILIGDAAGDVYGDLYFNGPAAQSLSPTPGGSVSVVFGSSGDNQIINSYNYYNSTDQQQEGVAVTFAQGVSIDGNTGSFTGAYYYPGSEFINGGSIAADAGGTLTIQETLSNQGALSASNNSTLNLAGGFTTSELNGGFSDAPGSTLELSGTLDNTSSTLALSNATGPLTLDGGTITGGTITEAGSGQLVATSSGVLDGVTLQGNLDLSQVNGATVSILDGLTLNGTILIGDAAGDNYGILYFQGNSPESLNVAPGGSASIVFGGSSNNQILNFVLGYDSNAGQNDGAAVTFGTGVTIHGDNGFLSGYGYYYSGNYPDSQFINDGTIASDGGGTIAIYEPLSNQGAVSASNDSTLDLAGNFTTSELNGGFSDAPGSTLELGGTLDNTGSTLALTNATGPLTLAGGTIIGGTISETSSGQLVASTSGTLDGVTLQGNLDLSQVNGATVNILDGLTLNGTILIGDAAGDIYGVLAFEGTSPESLTAAPGGSASIVFGGSTSNQIQNYTQFYDANSSQYDGAAVTFGVGVKIDGNDGQLSGYGYNNPYPNSQFINDGTIDSDGGGTITIYEPISNQGTVSATNDSTLNLAGNFTTSELNGGFNDAPGSTLELSGTLDNTGSTLALSDTTGPLSLAGGTITGGTISETSSGQLVASGSGTLDGVTLQGNLDLSQVNGATVNILNGLMLNGTILIGDAAGDIYGVLAFEGTSPESLTAAPGGSASIVFGGSTSNQIQNYTQFYDANSSQYDGAAVTFGVGVKIDGNDGQLSGYGYNNPYPNSQFINDGTIDSDGGGTITIYEPISNQGTVSATNDSTLNLAGNFTTSELNGGFNDAPGSTLELSGTLDNTGNTLALSDATGPLTLAGGTIIGGTISETSSGQLVASTSGTLDGVTLQGNLDLSQVNGATVNILDGLKLNGTILIGDAAGDIYGVLAFEGTSPESLTAAPGGSASIVFGGSTSNQIQNYTQFYDANSSQYDGAAVTFGVGVKIDGNDGQLSGYGYNNPYPNSQFINDGTIDSDGGGTITIYEPISNQGTVSATNDSTLNLAGNFTTSELNGGFSDEPGSTLELSGTLDNSGSTLALSNATGPLTLNRGTITGGTVAETGSGQVVFDANPNILDGVTVQGNLNLNQNDGATAVIQDGLTLNGSILIGDSAGDIDGFLAFTGGLPESVSATSGGSASIVFGGSSSNEIDNEINIYDPNTNQQEGAAVTFGAGVTIQGNNGQLNGYGYFGGGAYPGSQFINDGIINSDGGGTITIYEPLTNQGTLSASNNSTLNLAGSFTTSELNGGLSDAPGSTIELTGTLDNTGSTLALSDTTGPLTLDGGTITGGTITETNSGQFVFDANGNNLLDGVTVQGNLDLSQVSGASTQIQDGLILNGTILLGDAAGDTYGGINFDGASPESLTVAPGGSASIVFGGSGSNNIYNGTIFYDPTAGQDVGAAVTFGTGVKIDGNSGNFNGYSYYYYADLPESQFINDGTIASDGGGTFNVYEPITNEGTVSATNGSTIDFTTNAVNNLSAGTLSGGTWEATGGSTLSITGNVITDNATLVVGANSNIETGGSNALSGLTSIGTSGSLTLSGGQSLADTPAGGAFTNDGTLSVGAGGTLAVTGDFDQPADGTLEVELATPTSFGAVTATGAADVAGTLQANTAPGYNLPATADLKVVSAATTLSGTFSPFTNLSFLPLVNDYTSTSADIVVGSQTILLSPSSLTDATAGTQYNQTLTASGGTESGYSFSVISGQLPQGLSLLTGGLLSGTSDTAGISNFVVKVTDSGGDSGTQSYTLTTDPAAASKLVITGLPGADGRNDRVGHCHGVRCFRQRDHQRRRRRKYHQPRCSGGSAHGRLAECRRCYFQCDARDRRRPKPDACRRESAVAERHAKRQCHARGFEDFGHNRPAGHTGRRSHRKRHDQRLRCLRQSRYQRQRQPLFWLHQRSAGGPSLRRSSDGGYRHLQRHL